MARTRSGGSRMKKPCECCRRYLDHLEGKNQHVSYFFSRVDAHSRRRMIIPSRFVKGFAGKLSRRVSLESPNGRLYDVEVKERCNKTVLQRGWEAFVDANRIQGNDFVLFRHIEKSRFEVLVLGSDGCEKAFPCAGVRNTPSMRERSLDSVGISSSSCHETTESSSESSGSERFARCGRSSSRHSRRKASTSSSSFEESGEDTASRNKSFESESSDDDLQTPSRDGYVLSCGRYLSEAQREKVIALIQKIKPEVTVFVSIIRKSNVKTTGSYLVISKKYALAHLPHETTFITLQRPDKSKKWRPRFYIRNDKKLYMLRGKWSDFVRDNHVQQGDICLLIPERTGRKFVLTVYLVRATDTRPRGGSGTDGFPVVGPLHDKSSTEMTSVVPIKEESPDGEHIYSKSSMKEVSEGSLNSNDSRGPSDEESTDGEHVSSESSMKEISEASLNSSDSEGPSDPPYILPAKSCLSKSQKKIVEAKVRAIQSEVPIYVAIMKRTSVDVTHNKMLELGSQYAAAHLPAREQTMVLQCYSKIWNTKMEIRNGHRLFLRVGWSEFVHDNGLRVGDICLFELKKNERELTMEVHIIPMEQC